MTDQEVIELYRCLLGRLPENANTIKAFKGYYPNVDRGRKAVFDSNEFQSFYARVTGRLPFGTQNAAAELALALLTRLSASVPLPPSPAAASPGTAAGFLTVFEKLGETHLSVVVGDPGSAALDDLVPMGGANAAVLHIAPGFPPAVPLLGRLRDGTTLFRLGGDVESISIFLRAHRQKIDALFVLGKPGGADWVHALRTQFSPRALVVVGPRHPGFEAEAISAAIDAAHPTEPVQFFRGFRLHHFGGWLLPVSYAPPARVPALPDLSAYPRLAVAAIVRDEAVCIENMLRSVMGLASFVAVLDTGSLDATPALAQDFLRASGVPFAFAQRSHVSFDDDFSAMRNAALDMVPESVDWVLMLDADEELVPEDFEMMLRLAAQGGHDAYALPRYNFAGADKSGEVVAYPDRQVRLLRHGRVPPIRYEGRVHETVRALHAGRPPLDEAAMGGSRGGPHIHHLVRRFRTAEEEERKQAYYRDIARRRAG